MTPENFCYYLSGVLSQNRHAALSENLVVLIEKELETTLKEMQLTAMPTKLNKSTLSKTTGGVDDDNVAYRC